MNTLMRVTVISFYSGLFLLLTSGCANDNKYNTINSSDSDQSKNIQSESFNDVSGNNEFDALADLLGIYRGVQDAYYMKNKMGEDMVINGNRIPVASSEYEFNVMNGNKVSLKQTNLETGDAYFYNGLFAFIKEEGGKVVLTCKLQDGSGSNPTYILKIDKQSLNGVCTGNEFEPSFTISRENNGSESTLSSSSFSDEVSASIDPNQSIDGIYTFEDASAFLQITVSGDTWIGKTVIRSGMGEEYDEVSYESGRMKGKTLYESSGYVEIGYISGNNLTTSIGNSRVTLRKN